MDNTHLFIQYKDSRGECLCCPSDDSCGTMDKTTSVIRKRILPPCRNETQILRFRAIGYYDSPMGIYYGARYQVSSHAHFFLKQTFSIENL